MLKLNSIIPTADALISLEPEELGAILLRVFAEKKENGGMIILNNFESELFIQGAAQYPIKDQDRVLEAVREAFAWLEGQALLISAGGMNGSNGWRLIGRRGHRLITTEGFEAYKEAQQLPRQLLHPRIDERIFFNFQRGDYPTAVFLAFREVELAVSEKSGIKDELGVKLMRRAFDKDRGPLRDHSCEEGEREARAHLFAGAIGSYKNPHSHRSVNLKPADAVEMLMLASHLLHVLDTVEAVLSN